MQQEISDLIMNDTKRLLYNWGISVLYLPGFFVFSPVDEVKRFQETRERTDIMQELLSLAFFASVLGIALSALANTAVSLLQPFGFIDSDKLFRYWERWAFCSSVVAWLRWTRHPDPAKFAIRIWWGFLTILTCLLFLLVFSDITLLVVLGIGSVLIIGGTAFFLMLAHDS